MAEEQIQWDEQIEWQPQTQEQAANWGQEVSPEQASSWLTSPTTPPGDGGFGRVGTSVLFGAGTGAAIGAPTGVGIIPGAIGGAIMGGVSGIAGEVARQQGAPESVILASEVGAGLGVGAAKNIAEKGVLLVSPTLSKNIAKLFSAPKVEEGVTSKVKDVLFGKPSLTEGFTLKNSNEAQYKLRTELLGETDNTLNTISPNSNVSDILRGKLYDDLNTLRQQARVVKTKEPASYNMFGLEATPAKTSSTRIQNTFVNSPEYRKLIGDIGVLKEQGGKLEGTNISEMIKILSSENNTNPEVIKGAGQRILNLIQNGGTIPTGFTKGGELETKTLINENVREALKKRFDEFLERNLGNKAYSTLKQAEAVEFTAKARDQIPLLVNAEFKGSKDLLDSTLNAIRNSPEGKKEFAGAVFQHLRKFDDTKSLLSEFSKNREALRKTGVMSDQQLDSITNSIKQYDKLKDKGMRFVKIQNAIAFPLVGAIASQGAAANKSTPFGIQNP